MATDIGLNNPRTSGGGGTSVSLDWRGTAFNYLRGKIPTLVGSNMVEFDHGAAAAASLDYASTPSGTATAINAGGSRGGCVQLQTGTTGGSFVVVYPIGQPTLILSPKTDRWAAISRIQVPTIAAGLTVDLVRLVNSSLNIAVSLGIQGAQASGTTKLYWQLYDGTSAFTLTTTDIPTPGAFVDAAMWFDTATLSGSVGQLMSTGMVDVATQVTDLTHMPTSQAHQAIQLANSDAVNRAAQVDRMMCCFEAT